MPQYNPESDPEPTFTLTEVIERGLGPQEDILSAASITANLMEYAAARREAESDLPETVNAAALLDELKEEGRFIPAIVKEAIGRVAAREGSTEPQE